MRRTLAALAASLAALAALAAEDDGDFAASKGSAAEAQLHERLKSAIRIIPGTDTQYLIGGYLQLDALATRRKQAGDEQNTFIASTIPFGAADADYRLSGRQSTDQLVSRTPTGVGDVWTRLEANLFPLDGDTAPTLNQLFVRLADRLIVGKTYSTFMDEGALPTTLDYNGPSGLTFMRQWLVARLDPARPGLDARWFGGGIAGRLRRRWRGAQRAVERAPAGSRSARALRGRLRARAARGTYAAHRRHAASPLGTSERHVNGTGVSLSGSVNTFGDDTLLWHAATGKGIGRYFNDPLSATGVALGDRPAVRAAAQLRRHPLLPAPVGARLDDRGGREHAVDGQRRRPAAARRAEAGGLRIPEPRASPHAELIVGGEAALGRVDAASTARRRPTCECSCRRAI